MAKRFLSTINLPKLSSDPVSGSEGEIYYNSTSDKIRFYNGSVWADVSASTGGTASDSFSTISVPSGTNPQADSSTDILTLTSTNGVSITGNSTTDSIEFSTNATSLNTASTIVSRDADQAFDITAIDFDTADTIAAAVGRLSWDDGEGTLTLGLKGGNVNLSVGQEVVALCYNGTGSTINKGSVVYISGAQGQRPSITLSDADTEVGSSKTFGVVAENILNGAEGFVCTFGIVTGLNTSSFTAGQPLWLSSTAGGLTNSFPFPPAHSVFIGYCLHSHESSGRIFVNPQNGYEVAELHDVLVTSVADNHILSYEASTSLWKNQGLAAAIQEVDGEESGIDSDLLDGYHGSHYLDWTNTTNKPDPTITLAGDLSGSITLTDLSGGTLTATVEDDSHNHIISNVDGLQDALNAKAPLDSPALTGTPTAPTATAATNTTQIATTAFVRTEISNLVDAAPAALDTLNELAAALGDDPNYATTISTALGGKEPTITAGTTAQYWRGDKSWQTLDKSAVGLSNVENTALSTWSGSSNITTVGTLANLTVTNTITGSISGNAGTVTNGIYSNNTYSDPSWITALSWSKISSTPTTLSGYGITDAQPLDADLTAIAALTGTSGFLKTNGSGTWTVDNNTYLTTSSASSTYAPINSPTFTGAVTLSGDPSQALEAATKQYVDAVAQGLHIHASAQTATTSNISDLSNPGASIDGVTLTNNMRVLVKNQNTTSQNGIYVYSSSTGALTRATDFDTSIETNGGDFVFVTGGSVNNDTGWVQTEIVTTLGSDPILFQQFSGAGTYTAGNGLSLAGSQFSINTGITADLSTSQTLTNKTIDGANNTLTVRLASDITGFGSGVASFLATPTSSNLISAITDETGTGSLVFATSPTLTTPNIGVASATSINIDSTAITDTVTTSVTTNTATTISSIASGTYRSAEYLVQVTQGSKYTVSKLIMIHDGTNAHITEYSLIELGASRIPLTISATLSSGNVLLEATITDAASTNATVRVVKTAIVV